MIRELVGAMMFAAVASASAAPITTLTFSGTVTSGWDGGALFLGAPGSLAGLSYQASISYDAGSLGPCSNAPHGCLWTLGPANGVVETVTINSVTRVFNVASGQLQFNTGGGGSQQIILNPLSGVGLSLYNVFQDGSGFFGSPANLSPALNFSGVPLVSASAGGSFGSTSFQFSLGTLSAATARASVPEPATIALLGLGVLGVAVAQRRRRARA